MITHQERDRLLWALAAGILFHVLLLLASGLIKFPEYRTKAPTPVLRVELGPTRISPAPTTSPLNTPDPLPAQAPQTADKAQKAQTPLPQIPQKTSDQSKQAPSKPAPATPSASKPAATAQKTTAEGRGPTPTSAAVPAPSVTQPVTTSSDIPEVTFSLPVTAPVKASSQNNTNAPSLDLSDLNAADDADTKTAAPAGKGPPQEATVLQKGNLRFSGQMAGRGPTHIPQPDFPDTTPPGKITVDFRVDPSGSVIPGSIKFRSETGRIIDSELQTIIRATLRDWTFTPAPDPFAPVVNGQVTFTIVRK